MSLIPLLNSIFLIALTLGLTLFFNLDSQKEEEYKALPPLPKKVELPPSPFKSEAAAYEKIGTGPLALQWIQPTVELPDLREEIIYYGKNGRPDIQLGRTLFHISLKSTSASKSAAEGEKTYLVYQKGVYSFSPHNRPTSLWLEMTPLSSDASNSEYLNIIVTMKSEDGKVITTPDSSHLFTVKATEVKNPLSAGWELPGGTRVDGSLLARQRARYIGPDLFLEKHGGEEFSYVMGRDRIDFMDNDTTYSCFVKEGDFLIWKDKRWEMPKPDEDTTSYPLLVIKKMDDKLIFLELWEADGKGKLQLNLVKIKMHEPLPEVAGEFKFVGAKTWSQFIVECRGKRMTLRQDDWLVLDKDGWKKMETPEQIDAYVAGTLQGPLFVLEKMIKKEGRSVLMGHLFNFSRTEMKEIELGSLDAKAGVKS
jgi:hypothetical protein